MNLVPTVLGQVDSEDLGLTLPHEHVFINLTSEFRVAGLLNDYSLMVEEVSAFAAAGGATLIDQTTHGLTRGAAPDPLGVLATSVSVDGRPPARSRLEALENLSRETGVNVVVGAGFYRDPYLNRQWFDENSVDAIADVLIRDITEGIDGTNVRPGIIGEIGADQWYISAVEERSFRAAARAHKATGLPITTHAMQWPVGLPQLDLLVSEGVDPGRVVIGHCDHINEPTYHEELARRGAWVQFDTIRGVNHRETQLRLDYVCRMADKGYLDQVLISHDICRKEHLKAYGGNGYDFLPTTFAGMLEERGMTAKERHILLVENPRRMLSM